MKLILSEAIKLLPEREENIRTLRQVQGYLAQSTYSKKFLKTLMKRYGVYKAGKTAQSMRMGLVIEDEIGELFIETKLLPYEPDTGEQ